jgi:hypothetical protein
MPAGAPSSMPKGEGNSLVEHRPSVLALVMVAQQHEAVDREGLLGWTQATCGWTRSKG